MDYIQRNLIIKQVGLPFYFFVDSRSTPVRLPRLSQGNRYKDSKVHNKTPVLQL